MRDIYYKPILTIKAFLIMCAVNSEIQQLKTYIFNKYI